MRSLSAILLVNCLIKNFISLLSGDNRCKPNNARPICWERRTDLLRLIFSANFDAIVLT